MLPLKKIPLLVIDDDVAITHLIDKMLDKEIFLPAYAYSGIEAIEVMAGQFFPLVLSDIHLGAYSGLDLIPYVKANSEASKIIFLTGQGSMETALRAVREGAFDYIPKSGDLETFTTEINAVLKRAATQLGLLPAPSCQSVKMSHKSSSVLIGKSPLMVAMYRDIARAAVSNCNVLITGESGSGKELVARLIHEGSVKSQRPFVAVNCGALTETLLESELFGHVRGAFTGATINKSGLFQSADGGSLFLDEIGDISLGLQVKLLRAIQDGEIKPVGSTSSVKVDARIIAATHRYLSGLIKEEKFREDLFFRLKVIEIKVPPLRSRVEDIPELVNYFLGQAVAKVGKKVSSISMEALKCLCAYPWPGNVRELENAVYSAVAMASSDMLFAEDLPEGIADVRSEPVKGASVPSADAKQTAEKLDQLEKQHICAILGKYQFNRTRTAAALGIDRVTLYRKMALYDIKESA